MGNNLLAGSAFWFYEECQLNGFSVWQAVALNCSYIVLSDNEGYKLQKWWYFRSIALYIMLTA